MTDRLLDKFTARLTVHSRALQDRLAVLIALAVASAVAITGAAAYGITYLNVYRTLDDELIGVAAISSASIRDDLEFGGGLSSTALQAANVAVEVLPADNSATTKLDGTMPRLVLQPSELAVARIGAGASARTGVSSAGVPYRIVAYPLVDYKNSRYALVLGRPLEPTTAILDSLLYSLLFFGALGALGAAAIGFFISRSNIEPLRRLSEAVARVTVTNKLEPIEIVGRDEVAHMARAFNRMLTALESSRERQRRLIADAGHELRTPLTSMRTNVELLVADDKSGMLPEGARGEILRDVAEQLGEFTTLIGDLVQLSREDQVQASPEAIDLKLVVESALTRVKRRGGPGITWDVSLDSFYLLGEPDALERAVTNLLDNAVKFSPPEGTIHVSLQGDRLRVADEGPGISDDDLPHVFERFYRSDKARTTPGSGLGLSIVAQTVEAHGGWVKAAHAPEGGAEFTMRLPASDVPDDKVSADESDV